MISKNILKKIIIEQKNLFSGTYIEREKLVTLEEKSTSGFIVIISGIRRCGKSTLLSLFQKRQKEQSYYINFDDDRIHGFSIDDFEKLYEVFLELYGKESTFYFDEIQNIPGWEKFVRRLHDYGNRIYITGSNANLLSKELGTHLTGRYIQIELFPSSFREFLSFQKIHFSETDFYKREKSITLEQQFSKYRIKGGFLKYIQTEEPDFFKILYDNILYRDIVARYSLSHKKGITDIFYYLLSNIGKEFSYTTLKTISNISSITTIKEYISYLENSYLLFTLFQYDTSLKKQLINPKKIYAIDTGLAGAVSFQFSENRGRVLENMVFLELKRQGKQIYYHKEKYECDFLIEERKRITEIFQVTCSLSDPLVKKREVQGLLEAAQKYSLSEGYILTENEEDIREENGVCIHIVPIWKWMLL